jgi:hypothetical protein
MHEELHLLQMYQTGELQHDFLGVHAKTLTLPPDKLTLIFVYRCFCYEVLLTLVHEFSHGETRVLARALEDLII